MEQTAQQPQQEQPIKLRNDLGIIIQDDISRIKIRDPETVRYFKLGKRESKIVYLMYQGLDPQEILQHDEVNVEEEDLREFLGMMKKWGLLEGTKSPAIRSTKRKRMIEYLFTRKTIFQPDACLDFLIEKCSLLWSKPMLAIYALCLILGNYTCIKHAGEVAAYGLPLLADSWLITMFFFIVILSVIGFIHELAHCLVLRIYGGHIPEIGFYLKYFTPAFFSDLSDLYRIEDRHKKVWVLLAGPLVQMTIGVIACMMWVNCVKDTALADFLHLTITAAFFALAINLNPLATLDGYYALQSWLGIHALRRRAWQFFKSLFTGEKMRVTRYERNVFLWYGPLSVLYISFLMFIIVSFYFVQGFTHVPTVTIMLCILVFMATLITVDSNSEQKA